MMKYDFKQKKVNILFTAILAVYFILTIIKFSLVPSGYPSTLFKNLVIVTAVVMAIFAYAHAIYTLKKKAIIFILLIVGLGILGEIYTGIKAPVGSYYYTSFLPGPRIAGLPLIIPVMMHMAHIYIGYCVINYIYSRDRKHLWWPIILILSAAYGLCVMAIDASYETVYGGLLKVWVYPNGGDFFGVSMRTIVGWFVWAFVILGVFLIYESRISKQEISKPDFFPVIAYFLFFLTYLSEALAVKRPEFGLIGALGMLPFVVIALLVAVRDKHNVDLSSAG